MHILKSILLDMCMYPYYTALSSYGDLKQLMKEMTIMLSFLHPNLMSLIGVCIDGEMPLLIMPFMTNGNLLEYVKHHKEQLLLSNEATDKEVFLIIVIGRLL